MATTLKADMFVPEVATATASAIFATELALGFTGSPFVRIEPRTELGEEGDAVKFPRFDPLGEFTDMVEDTALTPEKLTTTEDVATVVAGGKATEITDFASLAARGNPSREVGRQMGILAARYADIKLVAEAVTTTLTQISTGVNYSYAEFLKAIVLNWGDKALNNVGGLVVHSEVGLDIMNSAEFKSIEQEVVRPEMMGRPNLIGRIVGIPVWISDRITKNAGPPVTYDNLILKTGALGLMFQRQLLVEFDRDILKKNDVIAGDVRLAPHLFFDNPLPAIRWNTESSLT